MTDPHAISDENTCSGAGKAKPAKRADTSPPPQADAESGAGAKKHRSAKPADNCGRKSNDPHDPANMS